MNKTQVTIPDYFNIRHYKALSILSSLNEVEQMIHTISVVCEVNKEDVLSWDISSVVKVYNTINGIISNTNQSFYPVIEWNGQLWGYQNMTKMKFGEYIDLKEQLKNVDQNLTSILAILYRPITSNRINNPTFLIKSTYKAMKHEVENVFDYYTIENYDSDVRKQRAPEFENFPLDAALGALSFFLQLNVMLVTNSEIYSLKTQMETIQKELKMKNRIKRALLNIMAGFLLYISWRKPKSFPLQEIKQ